MKQYTVSVVSNEMIAKDTYELVTTAPKELTDAFMPGQFAHLKIPGREDLLLRRPISIMDCDQAQGSISMVYALRQKGTRALALAGAGTRIDLLAPLGRPFPEISGKIWLLGGGVGIAPLYSVAKCTPGCTGFFGWADKAHFYGYDKLAAACVEVNVYTDDGSIGNKGFAINGMIERMRFDKPDAIFACGPLPMFRALSDAAFGVPCFVSMEQRMGCGVGACMTCACKVRYKDGFDYKRVCTDGPVFKLEDILYD